MSTSYRCKVRKPNGEIVDGCGHVFTPKQPEHYSRDGMQCGSCKVGFMRQTQETPRRVGMMPELGMGYERGGPYIQDLNTSLAMAVAGAQIHGGPLVVEAHRPTQAGSPEDKEARQEVLRAAHNRLSALRMGTAMGRTADDGTIRETIALLQSLLPASPEADATAQADMTEEHGARASVEEVAARLTGEYLGGCWSVPAVTLNAFFRQAYAHGKAERWAGAGVALERIAGLVGAVEGAPPNEIADCVASALQEVTP